MLKNNISQIFAMTSRLMSKVVIHFLFPKYESSRDVLSLLMIIYYWNNLSIDFTIGLFISTNLKSNSYN